MFSAAIKSGAAASTPVDAQFNYVTMLLHGDGTNGAQNNTFLDSSSNAFTITRNGNTTQGSFSPYGSNWANSFGGSSDYLSLASSTPLSLGTGDFTVEGWFYANSTASQPAILNLGDNTTGLIITLYLSQIYCYYLTGGGVFGGGSTVSAGKWYHFAWVRNGGVQTFYLNGVSDGTPFTNSSSHSSSGGAGIGWSNAGYSGFNKFNGYISNVRVVKGTAVYTSAFTPPTTPLTAITNTSLLTCQSNRFVDNSTNAATITPTNSPSVQRFNPFGASTAYSTSVIGGSGYFDGTGDYLTVPNNTALQILGGSFTLDCWIYLTAAQANMGIIGIHDNSTAGYFIRLDTTIIRFYTSAATVDRTYAFAQNTWYHIAVVSSGTTGTLYINGVAQGATFSTNGTQDTTDQFIIGKTTTLTNNFVGYISDVRVIKGSAVTPPVGGPTSPLTAVTNTQLLCNMTNAAIYDNAEMNDLETVGNAQISTSVKKYGTGSMYFDGTGDRLTAPTSVNYAMGTGDYTIEFWCYPSNSGYGCFIDTRSANPSTNGVSIFNNGTSLEIYANGLILSASGAFTLNTWQHFALSRSGTSLKAFVNGTQVGSTATNSDNLSAGRMVIGDNVENAYALNGYIDDLRITKGVARYVANFTPPTAAFPNIGPN